MSAEKPTFLRWYDRHTRLAQGVKLLILMPDEVKTIISEAMIALANREFDNLERENTIRTLGSEKVMGLHKSKNRRREYDVNETLHKAMNYLYMLSDEGQDFMSDHILNMVKYIHQYFGTCKEFQVNSEPETVAKVTDTYVNSGAPGVEKFLQQLREEFYVKHFKADRAIQQSIDLLETIQTEIKQHPPQPQQQLSEQEISFIQTPQQVPEQPPAQLEPAAALAVDDSAQKAGNTIDITTNTKTKSDDQGMKLAKLDID